MRRLAAHDAGMDLLGMDVTWTAEFAEAGWIRELTREQKAAATEDMLQPPIDTATWKDKLYGIPRTRTSSCCGTASLSSRRRRRRATR